VILNYPTAAMSLEFTSGCMVISPPWKFCLSDTKT